jgi:hypothetical protein
MAEQDRTNCRCDKQFLNPNCLGYAITSMEDTKTMNEVGGNRYFCERESHSGDLVMS